MSGPAPKPTALRVLSKKGRDRIGHRKAPTNEPKPRLGVVGPPKQLDPRAQKEYERIVDEMRRAAPALFTRLDDTELAIFCESKYQWLDLMEKIQADKADPKKVMDRFDVVMAAKFMQQMHMSGDRLGLSPVARTKLAMPDRGPVDGEEDEDF